MKCQNCGNNHNLKKIKLKGLPKEINTYICPRCWYIQLELTPSYKNKLIKHWAKEDLNKAKKIK